MSTTRKYTLPELKQMMRDNGIIGVTLMNKPEMLQKLNNFGLVPDEALIVKKEKKTAVKKKEKVKVDCIRNNPIKVLVTDVETGLEMVYPSIYKSSRELRCSTTQIFWMNGKVLRNKYKINILYSRPLGDDGIVPVNKSEKVAE